MKRVPVCIVNARLHLVLDKPTGTCKGVKVSTVQDTFHRPLRDLRISVIDQCNFRCTYCMPAEVFGPEYAFLHKDELLSFDEIERLVRIFVSLGAIKIRLTGGEPLLRKDLPSLVARLQEIDGVEDIALTTNGILLAKQAAPLAEAGLNRVTVSLDALDPKIFHHMNGDRANVERVLHGIDTALETGLPIKVNMVVERGVNESEIIPLASRFRHTGVILRMIEFMDVGNHNRWKMDKVVPSKEVVQRIHDAFPLEPVSAAYSGEVAHRYRYTDGAGEIGVISSVSGPFCRDCSRARLSADGQLYTCLFASEGWDLRSLLREAWTDKKLQDHIRQIWTHRKDRYSEERAGLVAAHKHRHKVEMSYIGG